jgi:uracil-DNA glycosylase family 4
MLTDVQLANRFKGRGVRGGVAIVLDFPTEWIVKAGRGFHTPRGEHISGLEKKILYGALSSAGFDTEKLYITFAVQHLGGAVPTEIDIAQARPYLLAELAAVRPTKILCVGRVATASLLQVPLGNIDKLRGLGFNLELATGSVYGVTTIPPYFVTANPERFKDISYDILKLSRKDEVQQEPVFQEVKIIRNEADMISMVVQLPYYDFISCDTETSGVSIDNNVIEALGLAVMHDDRTITSFIIPWELCIRKPSDHYAKTWFRYLLEKLKSAKVPLVFHNAKFDLQFIRKWLGGNPLRGFIIHDTLLMNYLLDERPINDRSSPHGLKNVSRVMYDASDYKFDFADFWKQTPSKRNWEPLYHYLSLDLGYTCWAYNDLMKELREESDFFEPILADILAPATVALANMEFEGAPIDEVYFREYGAKLEEQLEEAIVNVKATLREFGKDDEFIEEFNPGSPQQVSRILVDTLKIKTSGKKGKDGSSDKDALEEAIHALRISKDPAAPAKIGFMEAILSYRGVAKILSTYVNGLLEQSNGLGVVHTQFNIPGTRTGRLSADHPALQTIPQMAGPFVRRGFVAPPGHVWMKADYSQLELRVSAYLCQDEKMIQAFRDDRDIHVEVAMAMFGLTQEEWDTLPVDVRKRYRYAAKFVDFGILYGRGAYSLAYGKELREYNWTEKQAQVFIDNYVNQFPGLKEWMSNQRTKVMTQQWLETPIGRRRRWPFLTSAEAKEVQKQALNFPVQSVASDITLTALIKVFNALSDRSYKARLAITVHDELDLIVPVDEIHHVAELVKTCMETNLPIECNVPIIAEIEVGPNWADVDKYHPPAWWYDPDNDKFLTYPKGDMEYGMLAELVGPFDSLREMREAVHGQSWREHVEIQAVGYTRYGDVVGRLEAHDA